MATDFEWKEEYSVGVPLLDTQHKFMFEQGRKLTHLKPEQTKKLVVDLYRYILQHFTAEENHMKEIGFPQLDQHRAFHEHIVGQLTEMTTNFEVNERATLKLKLFFFNWLVSHIQKQDKKYFNFANQK